MHRPELNGDAAQGVGLHGKFAADTGEAVAALARCIEAVEAQGRPALLHLKLSADVITSRTTLSATCEAALKSIHRRDT